MRANERIRTILLLLPALLGATPAWAENSAQNWAHIFHFEKPIIALVTRDIPLQRDNPGASPGANEGDKSAFFINIQRTPVFKDGVKSCEFSIGLGAPFWDKDMIPAGSTFRLDNVFVERVPGNVSVGLVSNAGGIDKRHAIVMCNHLEFKELFNSLKGQMGAYMSFSYPGYENILEAATKSALQDYEADFPQASDRSSSGKPDAPVAADSGSDAQAGKASH